MAGRWPRAASDLMGIVMPSAEKALLQPFHELVLDEELIDELLRAKNHGKADARVAERMEPHERIEAGHAALARYASRRARPRS